MGQFRNVRSTRLNEPIERFSRSTLGSLVQCTLASVSVPTRVRVTTSSSRQLSGMCYLSIQKSVKVAIPNHGGTPPFSGILCLATRDDPRTTVQIPRRFTFWTTIRFSMYFVSIGLFLGEDGEDDERLRGGNEGWVRGMRWYKPAHVCQRWTSYSRRRLHPTWISTTKVVISTSVKKLRKDYCLHSSSAIVSAVSAFRWLFRIYGSSSLPSTRIFQSWNTSLS